MINSTLTIFRSSGPLVLIAVVAAIMVFLVVHETASATVLISNRDVTLATYNDRPMGMWGDGTKLWVVENDERWDGQYLVLSYNIANGSFNSGADIELDSTNANPQGVWSDGTVMWVGDEDDTKLYAYALSDSSRMIDRDIDLAGSNDGPRGMWGFNETILVIDHEDTKVYAYSTTDGSRLADEEFDLHSDNDNPWGIWGQGTKVWVSDVDDKMLYVYERDPNSSSHGDSVPSLEIRLPKNVNDVRSIWSDGKIMWALSNEARPKLYAMHYLDFRHLEDEIDITDVTAPAGLWTDGETMWVADEGRTDFGYLLAYKLSDQTRDGSKDVQLASFNKKPRSIWSDGETVWVLEDSTSNDFLYAYALEPEADEIGLLVPYKSVTLGANNSDPRGAWSDGEIIWVSDSGDDKLYAYDLSDRTRQSDRDLDLNSGNGNPGEMWSDGETIWVFDKSDKKTYAYNLSDGSRERAREFRTVPDNDDPDGGMTGHGLRFWVVDGDDQKLYAYGGSNTAPSFTETSVSFEFHRSIAAGDYIGSVPEVVDPDGDTITYLLTSGGFGVFRLDYLTGEIFVRDDASTFDGGENYTLTVAVTDSRSPLDGQDSNAEDAIDVAIMVLQNDDPEFTTADGTAYPVAEGAAIGHTVVELEITDLDDDSLSYEFWTNPAGPFQLVQSDIKVSNDGDLDYESTNSYEARIQVRDNKDESGQTDLTWDDEITFTIQVTNVEEVGELNLSSANPQVDTEIVATLTDPDGVELAGGNQVNWVIERSTDSVSWTEISDADSASTTLSYTPVSDDAERTLRFKATYKDGFDTANTKTIEVDTENTVLAAPPSNQAPTFGDAAPESLSVAENTAIGTNIGSPVPASDPENDTLTFAVRPSTFDVFDITSSGQLFIKDSADLDYEGTSVRGLWIWLRDSKDPSGEADSEWDETHFVKIHVTNADEAGTVTLSSNSPEVEVELDARLRDPDHVIHNLTWQWQTAESNPSDAWADISGATSQSYTPAASDAGKYIRAKASYDDGEGTGKEAIGTAPVAVIVPDNRAPQFNEGATATRSVNENAVAGTRLGAAITALDPDMDALTYSLAAGSDSDKFVVDSGTGQLEVAAGVVFDYETAQDFEFEAVVQVSDGKAADHTQDTAIDDTITVTIDLVNVDEPGEVALSMMEPVVGESITATLSDDDGGVTGANWQWEKSQDGATNWETMNGAESDSYTPATGDEGMYLRAMVDYTDDEGAGKSAEGMTSDTVQPESDDEDIDDGGQDPEEDSSTENTDDNNNGGGNGQEVQQETFKDICRRDHRAGLIANCVINSFATATVGHDGSYTIDWSEWDEDHPDVTGYTIVLQEMLYKTVYENGQEISVDTLSDVYETCEFTDGSWTCVRPVRSNYFEDWNGNPVDARVLVEDSDLTQWSGSLDSPGRHTADKTFQRWSGDAADPNNEPTPVTYTTQELEMDMHYFEAHGGSARAGVVAINGANGFD